MIEFMAVGLGQRYRHARYAGLMILGLALFGGLSGAYYFLTPPSYSSGFSLILPGAGAGASVNLADLGQASSVSASPYSNQSISPTQSYKKLLTSDRIKGRTAGVLGIDPASLSVLRIKLTDQTQLINVGVKAGDAEAAQRQAEAYLETFLRELELLRDEEMNARYAAYGESLAGFEDNVANARAAVISFKASSGLNAIEQYEDLITYSDALLLKKDNALNDVAAARAEAQHLSKVVGIDPELTPAIITLISDDQLAQLCVTASELESQLAKMRRIYGRNHPEFRSVFERASGANIAVGARARLLIGLEAFRTLSTKNICIDGERAELISRLIDATAQIESAEAKISAFDHRRADALLRIDTFAELAAQLDALERKYKVAETVFASALARLDTTRTDIFTSYPLVQVLETPALPERPSSPSKKIAVLGGVAGFMIYMFGVALLWLRLPLIRMLWKIV